MHPRLLHLYGPVWIHSYGTMIALGLIIFIITSYRHPLRTKLVEGDQYLNTIFFGLIMGIIGGRLGYALTNWQESWAHGLDLLLPWEGGFTAEGSIITLAIALPIYLYHHKIPILPLLDLAAIHAPIIQAWGRIGCVLSGCCYGLPMLHHTSWSITFYSPASTAPVGIPLYPTQLYMSIGSLIIFILLWSIARTRTPFEGFFTTSYLFMTAALRAGIDPWRGDRTTIYRWWIVDVSRAQIVALILMAIALLGYAYCYSRSTRKHQ